MRGTLIHTVTILAHGVDPLAPPVAYKSAKSSPGYEEYAPAFTALEDRRDDPEEPVRVKSVGKNFVVVEAEAPFAGTGAAAILAVKDRLNDRALAAAAVWGPLEPREEFSFYCVTDYDDIDGYLDRRRSLVAQLLKDERCDVADDEVAAAFAGAVRYEPNDMTVVDWDGAALFDRRGAFDDEIALLELANAQLMALRGLDAKLGREIDRFRGKKGGGTMGLRRLSVALRSIVTARTDSLLELDAIDDAMRLYGEWYDAKVYALGARKLNLDKWRNAVDRKLGVLEKMFEMVSGRQGELYNIVLEMTIVALIVIEIVLAIMGHA
jgi:hypothetical protein